MSPGGKTVNEIILQIKQVLSGIPGWYLTAINAAGFIAMAWDKMMSKMEKKRIPEKSLFLMAAVGRSAGIWLGMQLFRHKTRHARFVYGIPLIFACQAAAAVFIIYYF